MANFNILTLEGLKQKQKISANETFDFLSVRIGTSNLEIKETTGAFDFGAANLTNVGTVDGRDVSADGAALDGHIDGGANKHDASEVDFEDTAASAKNLAAGSVEAALTSLDDAIGALDATPTNYTPADPAIVADHLAAIDGALAAAAGTDIPDDEFRISDDADATKKMAFEVGAITTGTTRTVTMPDANVDLGLIATAIQSSEKGANNGVATLDGGGKIPASQLPNSVMELQGAWNASTNTPELADGVGNPGDVYEVTVAGSQDLGSGSLSFDVGDFAIYGSSGVWYKSDSTDAVASVNGQTGVVVLDTDDVSDSGATNKYFTDAAAKAAAVADSITDGVTDVAPSQNAVFDALALKADASHTHEAADITDFDAAAKAAAVADAINDGTTDVAPSQNSVFDALALKADASSIVTHTASNGIKLVSDDFQRDDSVSKTNDNAGSITVRQVVYVKSSGNVDLAQATVAAMADAELGIVEDASIATTASGKIIFRRGAIVGGFSGMTPGKEQIVSRSTPGALVEDLTGFQDGEMVFSVGKAISATELVYNPEFKFEF